MSKLHLYKKLIKYRRRLINHSKLIRINKIKYILICDFYNFNSLAIKLLKLYFLSKNKKYKFNPYKNLINKLIFNKFITQSVIYFKFLKLNELLEFINYSKKLTLIPFLFCPVFILNKNYKIMLPFKNINITNLLNLKSFYLNILIILKKIILNLILKLNTKINKECLPLIN